MKQLIKILTLALMLGISLPGSAVTQKEMDKARALAAKAYLRYANDGSGYLDEITPSSMADLEKSLKAKEKENLKAFKDIQLPSGYESWGKEKLAEFWGNAFSTPGLVEKGRLGRSRAKKYIGEMTIAEVSQSAGKTPEIPKETEKAAETPASTPKAAEAPEPQEPAMTTVQETSQLPNNPVGADVEQAFMEETQVTKVKDNSTMYIVILVILVAAVIALVVFASNVMKKNGASARRKESDSDSYSSPRRDDSGKINELREKYSASLASKNNEISDLTKKIEALSSQNGLLRQNVESLSTEVGSLKRRLTEATAALQKASQVSHHVQQPAQQVQPIQQPAQQMPQQAREMQQPTQQMQQPVRQIAQSAQETPQSTETPRPQGAVRLRTIYLGKVNAKGIFIRADRNLSLGNSVYRLDTSDGYSGSFRVADDATVAEMALLTPRETLSGGCIAPDIEDTAGMNRIVTDAAGTAIFENGCWKVLRKAKIHFEE